MDAVGTWVWVSVYMIPIGSMLHMVTTDRCVQVLVTWVVQWYGMQECCILITINMIIPSPGASITIHAL